MWAVQGETYLHSLQSPRLYIPFSLRDSSYVVVNKQAFCGDPHDQAVRYVALS